MSKLNGKNSPEIATIINKLSDAEMEWFSKTLKDSGMPVNEINEFKKIHAKRNEKISTLEIKSKDRDLVDVLYKDELQKLIFLTNNNELINKLNGLKILLHGESGTGKTSFAKSFIEKMHGNYLHEEIHFEKLISYKMGQTQNNLLKLLDSIIYKSQNQKMIVFIDEIDSIVVNREASNDIGEHARVVASFLKFIDSIPKTVILIAATNVSNNLDKALMRRFNVKIEGKLAKKNIMIETLSRLYPEEFSERLFNSLLKDENLEFTISEINNFINEYEIEKTMNGPVDLLAYFFIKFKDRLKTKLKDLSVRVTKSIKKLGDHE